MKVKQFVKMASCEYDCINIFNSKNEQLLKECDIKDYLNSKKSINGNMISWYLEVENWDYPVMNIIIE